MLCRFAACGAVDTLKIVLCFAYALRVCCERMAVAVISTAILAFRTIGGTRRVIANDIH